MAEDRLQYNGVSEGVATGRERSVEQVNIELSLRERNKELTCIYRLGEVIDRCEDASGSLDVLFQGSADILPVSWLHSDIACARIVYQKKEYTTEKFSKPLHVMTADLVVDGEKQGCVEVGYLQETPVQDEGPFLKEERYLLNAIAERLGKVIERLQAGQIVRIARVALQHKNIALGQVLDRIQEEKATVGKQVLANVDRIIMPMLEELKQGLSRTQQQIAVVLRESLLEIVSPFVDRLSQRFENLTPSEIRICTLIKRGLSSKEIAAVEHVSPGTVRVHRFKIRRKLGLVNREINLQSFLQSAIKSSPK